MHLLEYCYYSFMFSASCASPTVRDLRASARLLKVGLSLEFFNHSFRVSVKQSSTTQWLDFLMASRVPAVRPNSKPVLYHLDRASHTALWTAAKSSTVRRREASSAYNIY